PDPDPSGFLTSATATPGGNNSADFRNPTVDHLIAEAATTSDRSRRNQLYQQIQDLVSEELPQLPIISPKFVYGATRDVHGIAIGPYTSWIRPWMKDVWIEGNG
ncbi:MAG: hypothetical protein WAM30_04170, partial [Candidatus Dormiibacterota bacterium]